MNYKFSKRELLLFKILGAAILMIGLFSGTSYVAGEITKSKNLIFLEVNKFKTFYTNITIFYICHYF